MCAAELRPGELLDQFLQRADPARQRDEGVGALEHDALALVHVLRHHDLAGALEHAFPHPQELGDDPDHLAAMRVDRVGERPHQPGRSTAIDEADAVFRQDFAEMARGRDEIRVGSRAGTAINADIPNVAHGSHLASALPTVKARPAGCRRRGRAGMSVRRAPDDYRAGTAYIGCNGDGRFPWFVGARTNQ